MINARKAREMIEGIDQNKEQLESTFEHLEKMIMAACDKKEYIIKVDLGNAQLPYDVKLCLGNKALRKHVTKKMEKSGFNIGFDNNIYTVNWIEDNDDDEKEEVEIETSVVSKPAPEIKTSVKRASNVSTVKDEKTEQKAPKQPAVKKEVAKVETKSDTVVFKDPILDFSEFDDILKA